MRLPVEENPLLFEVIFLCTMLLLCIIFIWFMKKCFMKLLVGGQSRHDHATKSKEIEIIHDTQKTQDEEERLILYYTLSTLITVCTAWSIPLAVVNSSD